MHAMDISDTLLLHVANASKGPHQPADGLAALDQALRRHPGHKLFTVLAIDRDRDLVQRIYTNDAVAYPLGGVKPLHRESDFFRQVVQAGVSRICRNRAECHAAFSDHRLIDQLGCESAINVPIRHKGETLGSLNLLHASGWYTPQMIPDLNRFAALAASLLKQVAQCPSTS
jgi:hypothetical protein